MKCPIGHKLHYIFIKLFDDSMQKSYQIFKCEICDKFFVYFHGKLRDLDDLKTNEQIIEHFHEGSD